MNGTTAYALSKQYVADTADSLGSLKGAPCTIKSITEVDGGQKVTFEWIGTSGTKQTSEMTVKNGLSVTDIDVNANNQIVFTMSDGSEIISGKIPTVKGDKGDPFKYSDFTQEQLDSLKGSDGFSPSAKIEKVGDTATITITDKDGTTTATIKDGQGGTGGSGEENKIDSISVNGVNVAIDENKNVDITVPSIDGLAKTEDIPTKVSELTNDSGYLTEHQDISGKVDKVDGKSLIADTEIERLASVDNYDDTQVKTQIQAVANGLMDSVGYSADYKTIDIIAKNGVKKSVNVAPIISHASITELSDVDTTNKATGKALVYNATTSKHEYADVSGTDEKVKMDASTDAKYLGELLDNVTIANENGELKVKKLDGQEVTITEINYLKGLTMNVMDLVNMFSNGGVKIINTPVATYAELLTLDKSSFIEGVSYLVYVLADENHDNAKTTYLVDKDSETPTYFGFADSQRDFTTNPIDLATEITGKLGIANMDSDAIKALFTVDDTYKTETATNNAFSTHGAKALYDELLLAIGNKANNSDLTAHKNDTAIHVSTEDRTNWDSAKTHADSAHAPSNAQENVLETVKVNGTALEVSNKAVNVTVPTTVSELTDSSSYAKKTDIPATLPANGGNADTVNNHNVETNVPADAVFTDTVYDDTEVKESIEEVNSNLDVLEYGEVAGGKNLWRFGDIKVSGNVATEVLISDIFKSNTQYTIKLKTKSFTTSDIGHFEFIYTDGTKTIISWDKTIGGAYATTSDYGKTIDILQWTGWNPLENAEFTEIQLEEGTTATPYELYIPSVKMLANEVSAQNESLVEQKMLGWTVPSECPIQNYTDSDGVFHQRVGRVDLGTLDWSYVTNPNRFNADFNSVKFVSTSTPIVAYSTKYDIYSFNTAINKDKAISVWGSNDIASFLVVIDSSYTDADTFKNAMKGVYLYYELATPITKTIDGNEAVEELSSNLSQLEFGEIAGVRNLFEDEIKWMENIPITRGTKSVSDGKITLTATSPDCYTDHDVSSWKNNGIKTIPCKPNTKYTFSWEYEGDSAGDIYIFENGSTNNMSYTHNNAGKLLITTSADAEFLTIRVGVRDSGTSITYWNFQLEEGDTATEYEPYIPSVKMLATENEQQNTEAMDLKMLGWTVPSECPIQNYVDGNGIFHQRVGRIDLGSLEWIYDAGKNNVYGFAASIPNAVLVENTDTQIRCFANGLNEVSASNIITLTSQNLVGLIRNNKVYVTSSYTSEQLANFIASMQDKYLYYELATPITMTIDENEVTERINKSLSVIGKCKNLLKPTLQTTTQNGVTCTRNVDANGKPDGTYTLNGTASGTIWWLNVDIGFDTNKEIKLEIGKKYKYTVLNGIGSDATIYGFVCQIIDGNNVYHKDFGSGVEFVANGTERFDVGIMANYTCDNLVIKPMLTTNLNATYDDFVPYTGDGETLASDVAELKNDLGGLTFSASGTTLTITDGTNTWTLGANS